LPYNSSSFERQLAKYKQAEAEKAVGDLPRKKYEVYDDPHQIKSAIPAADRGHIKSYALDPVQLMGEGGQTAPVINRQDVISIQPMIVTRSAKKPFYLRTWFVLLVITTLPTLAMPVMFKAQWAEMMGIVDSIKTSTGVDPLSIKTYANMFHHRAAPQQSPEEQADAVLHPNEPTVPAAASQNGVQIDKNDMAQPMDMGNAVQKAQERTESITSKGTDYSMKYIEDETNRLNAEARKFDEQYKK